MTGDESWLSLAGGLLDTVLKHFVDEASGSLYDTADDAEELIRRPQDPTDNATPSGWTAAANALLTYAAYTGSERHRSAAERALGVVGALTAQAARFIGWGLAAAEALADGPREVAVVGPAGDPRTAALHRTALLATAPGAVVALGEPGRTRRFRCSSTVRCWVVRLPRTSVGTSPAKHRRRRSRCWPRVSGPGPGLRNPSAPGRAGG